MTTAEQPATPATPAPPGTSASLDAPGTPPPRRRLRGSRRRFATVVAVGLVAAFLAIQFGRQVYASYAIGRQAEQLEEEIAAVEAENAELQEELRYLRSDAYVSQEARRLANLGAPDEQILIIPPGAEAEPPALARDPVPKQRPMLEQWLELFFGT